MTPLDTGTARAWATALCVHDVLTVSHQDTDYRRRVRLENQALKVFETNLEESKRLYDQQWRQTVAQLKRSQPGGGPLPGTQVDWDHPAVHAAHGATAIGSSVYRDRHAGGGHHYDHPTSSSSRRPLAHRSHWHHDRDDSRGSSSGPGLTASRSHGAVQVGAYAAPTARSHAGSGSASLSGRSFAPSARSVGSGTMSSGTWTASLSTTVSRGTASTATTGSLARAEIAQLMQTYLREAERARSVKGRLAKLEQELTSLRRAQASPTGR